jgi:hypothetical protein
MVTGNHGKFIYSAVNYPSLGEWRPMKRIVYGIVLTLLLTVVLTYQVGVVGAVEQITEQEFADRVQTYDETQLQGFFQSLASGDIEVLVSDPMVGNSSWYVMLVKKVADSEDNAIQNATVTVTNTDASWGLNVKAAVPAESSWENNSATSVTDEYGYCCFYFMWAGGGLSQSRMININITKNGFLASSNTEIINGIVFYLMPDETRAPYYGYNSLENVLMPIPMQVIPEVPLGTILVSAAMIAALGLYVIMPRRQRKQKALIS